MEVSQNEANAGIAAHHDPSISANTRQGECSTAIPPEVQQERRRQRIIEENALKRIREDRAYLEQLGSEAERENARLHGIGPPAPGLALRSHPTITQGRVDEQTKARVARAAEHDVPLSAEGELQLCFTFTCRD